MIKWLYRLAWLFVLLGIAGSIVIVIWLLQDNNDLQQENSVPVAITGDSTIAIQSPAQQRTTEKNSIDPVVTEQESRETKKIPETKTTTRNRDENKNEPADKGDSVPEVLLTQTEQEKLLEDLQQALEKFRVPTNCVRLLRADDESNSLIFLQIELLLKSHNFTIAGRETIRTSQKGIFIGFANECLKLTIGIF